MAKRKNAEKDVEVKEVEEVTPVVQEQKVLPHEQALAQPAEAEVQPETTEAKGTAEEPIFLPPHDVYRVVQEGEVVESDGLHLVLKGQDGKTYAIPYVDAAHKDLKAGDKYSF
jgi:hypothetical protein